ncbi:MAG: hypothetical protein SPE82_04420 [Succinivibrio sp.]|nr:hypothetical protein [Succinatimonas sp.]MDY5063943.1 hypothetical protein [Succinivibrio sp.]
MSATLTRSSLDSYLNLNVQNSNSVTQNNLHVSSNSDNGVDFAKALSILTSSANKTDSFKDSFSSNSVLSDTDDNYFLSQLSSAYQNSANDDTEEVTANNKSSLEERFSVLNNSPKKEEWELLEKKVDDQDYSILSKLGDGLLTAAKFAASAYLGKVI